MKNIFPEINKQNIYKILTDPYYSRVVKDCTDAADEYIKSDPPRVKFSMIHEYVTNGNRERFQAVYENYQGRLQTLFLAYLLTENEKYLEPLADVLWNICDFESWSIPAHVSENEPVAKRRVYLDLTSTILGSRIAEIVYLIGDKLPELVTKRAREQVIERIVESYEKYTYHWESWENNWSSVCISSVMLSFMLLCENERTEAQLPRMISALDCYLKSFDEEGCCLEGYAYWYYGFSYFAIGAEALRIFTDGEIDYFKLDKVHKIAKFQESSAINDTQCIPFSDCGFEFNPMPWITHFLKNKYPDVEAPSLAARIQKDAHLRQLFWMDSSLEKSQMSLKDRVFSASQWFIHHEENYSLAAKAGHNDELHNHNDIGSFVISKGGSTTFTDSGTGEYTKQYFSPDRYELFVTSSRGHSVPIINGQYQTHQNKKSMVYRAEGGEFFHTIDNGYEIPTLTSATRRFLCAKDRITLTDNFIFSEMPTTLTERFISVKEPRITDDGVQVGDSVLIFDKSLYDVKIGSEEVPRPGSYKSTVYFTDITPKTLGTEMTLEFKFI